MGSSMYTLTLTIHERKAIDHVGYRYSNGNDLYKLLWVGSKQTPDDADWDDARDITFIIPENVAQQIKENADNEDGIGLFLLVSWRIKCRN